MIPPNIRTFQDLARWLIDTRHDGKPYDMAKVLKVSAGLPYQWKDGLVKVPQRPTIERLCEAYELDFWEVYKLVIGPPRRRRGAAIVVLALSLLGWASAEAQPLPLDNPTRHNPGSHGKSLQNQQDRLHLIGMARRFLWWFGCDWCTIAPAY